MMRRIYDYSPLSLQNIFVAIEGQRIQWSRYGKDFEKIYREYQERVFWTRERTEKYRDERLSAFVASVFQCPRQEALERFSQIGLMNKTGARRYFQEDLAGKYGPIIRFSTSGTTGAGLTFYSTLRAHQEQWALWWRYRDSHGISRQEWCLYFSAPRIVPLAQSKPPFWRVNRPGRQVLFSVFHLNKATAPHYLAKIKQIGHRWIHGLPEFIASLASYANELGIRLPMKWVTTSAENLSPHQSRIIEQVFGVKPIQHYGMKDGVATISECPNGKLHVDEDYSLVEFIKTDLEDNSYRIVGTNFTNPVFPFLRYDTGDLATLVPGETCDCGRPGRVVNSIDGRTEDYVVTASGKLLGQVDLIFTYCVNIYSAQIVQDRPGFLTFKIVRAENYGPKDEEYLREQIRLFLGKREEMDYEIQYVDEIPKTPAGKHRLVVSSLKTNVTA
jgi:phenylacetate-CoA ligase